MGEGFAEYKLIEKRVTSLEHQITEIQADVALLRASDRDLGLEIHRLVLAITGDKAIGIRGFTGRLSDMDVRLSQASRWLIAIGWSLAVGVTLGITINLALVYAIIFY